MSTARSTAASGAEITVAETAAAAAPDSGYEDEAGFSAAPQSAVRSAESENLLTEQAAASVETSAQPGDPIGRKLIRSVSISAETDRFDTALNSMKERVTTAGGYIEQFNSSRPSGDSSEAERNAYIRARIPADRLDEFLGTAFSGVQVTFRSETTQDVTLQYTDIDARERTLRVEQERLMELLAEAQSADSLIALEQRLSEIRYEIESLTSQLRLYDNQVQYSTVAINLTEVRTVSATPDDGFLAQFKSGFSRNLENMGIALRNAALFLLTGIPVIVPVAVILILVYSISKWIRRRVAHQKEESRETVRSEERTEQDLKMELRGSGKQDAADDKAGKTGIHRS